MPFERMPNKGATETTEDETVKELFKSIDSAYFICPGGPLKNYVSYMELKRIFAKNPDIKIEEVTITFPK